MRIETQDKKHVRIVMHEKKAADLLAGLLEHPDLGEEAKALAEKLRSIGITPPPPPDHIRHEYAPPNDD